MQDALQFLDQCYSCSLLNHWKRDGPSTYSLVCFWRNIGLVKNGFTVWSFIPWEAVLDELEHSYCKGKQELFWFINICWDQWITSVLRQLSGDYSLSDQVICYIITSTAFEIKPLFHHITGLHLVSVLNLQDNNMSLVKCHWPLKHLVCVCSVPYMES